MITEPVTKGWLARRHRLDAATAPSAESSRAQLLHKTLIAVIAIGFAGLGGGALELNDVEARLGLAAGADLGPFGQVFGGYDPSLSVGTVAVSQFCAWLEGGIPTTGAIRWPATFAAIGIGLLLSYRLSSVLGSRAGVFAALTSMASVGLIERSSSLGGDCLLGVAVLATLDRALSRGTDWWAGVLASLALLLGGWPALAAIVLALIAIGRPGGTPSVKLLIPPLVTFVAWTAWAWSVARAEVWAATLGFPITAPSTWTIGLWALAAGLPWSPFAAFALWPSRAEENGEAGRRLVTDWLKVSGVGFLLATIVPGFGASGAYMVVGGLAVAAAAVLDRAWTGLMSGHRKALALGLSLLGGLACGAVAIYFGSFLAAAQPYYRGVGIVAIGLGLAGAVIAVDSAWVGASRGVVRTLILVAILIKVLHVGFRVPEANYRFGKGPWGRAVGQYVPPKSPIYVFHSISPALAFATEHPVRQLRSEDFLMAQPGTGPKFILLTDSEFEHWPEDGPKILKVRSFQDEYGGARVLARTPGKLVRYDVD